MRSFLLNSENKPIIPWGNLADGTLYEGLIPENYSLAINPHKPYIIVDVDRHSEKHNGFDVIPEHLKSELELTLNYPTKNNGKHFWFFYTGSKHLPNKASGLGIDLRVWNDGKNNGGYVKWHPRNTMKIEDVLWMARPTSKAMNKWIEGLFSYVH